MKKRYIALIIAAVLILVVLPLVQTVRTWDGHKRMIKDLEMDESIKGTSMESTAEKVRTELERGEKTIPLQDVLEDKDGYVCAIRTSFGPMTLKVKDGRMREDILWGNSNTTAFIIDDRVYRYSSFYSKWLSFDYSSDMEIRNKQMTYGVFSEFELMNKTSPENVTCIRADVPEEDFQFPAEEAVDVEKVIEDLI